MPTEITLTPDLLVAILSAALSLIFAYVPKVKGFYSALDPDYQAFIMLIGIVVVALIVFGANCGAFLVVVNLACTKQGLVDLAWYIFLALTVNQSTYLIGVKPIKAGLALRAARIQAAQARLAIKK